MMFMVPHVAFRAPLPVKITYVTYEIEHVWSVNLEYMAVTVIYRVPPTVITMHVTCRMGHMNNLSHLSQYLFLYSSLY